MGISIERKDTRPAKRTDAESCCNGTISCRLQESVERTFAWRQYADLIASWIAIQFS